MNEKNVSSFPVFRTPFNPHVIMRAEKLKCSKTRCNYKKDERGALVKIEDIPQYDIIQSFKEEYQIENILRRVGGFPNVAIDDSGVSDYTDLPNSLMQVENAKRDLVNNFAQLPDAIKQYYGNNSSAFVASVKNGTFSGVAEAFFRANSGSGSTGKTEEPVKSDT